MCHEMRSDCCGASISGVLGLPLQLRLEIEALYQECAGEMIATCFCSHCGRAVCVSCLN